MLNKVKRICKIKGCNGKYYARDYCSVHYARFLRTGSTKRTKYDNKHLDCKAPGCNRKAAIKGYCGMHYQRWLKYHSTKDMPKGAFGSRNGNWHGGTSEYTNYPSMKKNRLLKLKKRNYRCRFCNKRTNLVFHINRSKSDHSMKNLSVACLKCGREHYSPKRYSSKYLRKYGMSLKDMVARYGMTEAWYSLMSKRGKLGRILKKYEEV